MNKIKLSVIVFTLLILLIAIFQTALAASKKWNGKVGGVGVMAQKTLHLGSHGWTTYLDSDADSRINIIGMTYWTLEEFCPATGSYAYHITYSGAFLTNASHFGRSAYVVYRGCSGQSRHKSHGNHDFAHGSDHLYPYVAVTVYR